MPKLGLDRSKTGRAKGTPNKTTALLKDAILTAAKLAGGKAGLVGFLKQQAIDNPGPFMALLGKVLPLQLTGPNGGPIEHNVVSDAERFTSSIARLAERERPSSATEPTQH